jgi:hypothetical protein
MPLSIAGSDGCIFILGAIRQMFEKREISLYGQAVCECEREKFGIIDIFSRNVRVPRKRCYSAYVTVSTMN